jgi:hypothetical protein
VARRFETWAVCVHARNYSRGAKLSRRSSASRAAFGCRGGWRVFRNIASYQDFAITVMMRASESTSRVSITSAGECE